MNKPTTPSERPADTIVADDHPLWYVNEVIVGMIDGFGAPEDHEALIKFLKDTGLPEGTARLVHRAIAMHHQWGKEEYLTEAHKNLPEQVALRAEHEGTIQAARDNYADADLEINDTPILSPGEDGVWVGAWVWVDTTDETDEEDDTTPTATPPAPCQGIEIEPGVFSGCSGTGGDCPVCGR